jgi:hypothetical protein
MAADGKLIFAWYDSGAEGVTVADGTVILGMDFEVVGEVGSATALVLGDSPAVREASVSGARVGLGTQAGSVSVVTPDAVRVGEAAYEKGLFRVSVPTVAGLRYVLEFTDGLPATNWTTLLATEGDGTLKVLTDPAATNTQRFYRVRVE